jgi:predicted TIM-barrel fold metal-dependent hydrolase
MTVEKYTLPEEFVDAHHHYVDTQNNTFCHDFLVHLLPNALYLPEDYQRDVINPLQRAGVQLIGSVHMEAMPDNGRMEAEWVSSFSSSTKVMAIVASCDLAKPDAGEKLLELKQQVTLVKGVRWILDCVGKFAPDTATHVATLRHDGIDYLRGSEGGFDGHAIPEFEAGFSLLRDFGYSFDLQCAPAQLLKAAELCARKHPDIPVVINHIGKPRLFSTAHNGQRSDDVIDENELQIWCTGMEAMAKLPNVYVKLSMFGYIVLGWIANSHRREILRNLVLDIVNLFGANHCMVALNWWKDAATSDSDGRSDVGPDPVTFLQYMSEFFKEYNDQDRKHLFSGTAKEFYHI